MESRGEDTSVERHYEDHDLVLLPSTPSVTVLGVSPFFLTDGGSCLRFNVQLRRIDAPSVCPCAVTHPCQPGDPSRVDDQNSFRK